MNDEPKPKMLSTSFHRFSFVIVHRLGHCAPWQLRLLFISAYSIQYSSSIIQQRKCSHRYLNGYVNFIRSWISRADGRKESRYSLDCFRQNTLCDHDPKRTTHRLKKGYWWLSHKHTCVTHRRQTIRRYRWSGRVSWPKYIYEIPPPSIACNRHCEPTWNYTKILYEIVECALSADVWTTHGFEWNIRNQTRQK